MGFWAKSKRRFYTFVLGAIGLGYGWLLLNYWGYQPADTVGYAFCLFKEATGLPCPACGATRSLLAITEGALSRGFLLNPIGFFLAAIMVLVPFWIALDLIKASDSFRKAYQTLEIWFTKRKVYVPFFSLILLNWIWNILKGL